MKLDCNFDKARVIFDLGTILDHSHKDSSILFEVRFDRVEAVDILYIGKSSFGFGIVECRIVMFRSRSERFSY